MSQEVRDIETFDDLPELVRDVLRECVFSWSAGAARVLLKMGRSPEQVAEHFRIMDANRVKKEIA